MGQSADGFGWIGSQKMDQWTTLCGQRQTMNHIVDTRPLTKFEGGLNLLHEADDYAVIWLHGIYSDCSTREINNKACVNSGN